MSTLINEDIENNAINESGFALLIKHTQFQFFQKHFFQTVLVLLLIFFYVYMQIIPGSSINFVSRAEYCFYNCFLIFQMQLSIIYLFSLQTRCITKAALDQIASNT